jgi:hypothetical protein
MDGVEAVRPPFVAPPGWLANRSGCHPPAIPLVIPLIVLIVIPASVARRNLLLPATNSGRPTTGFLAARRETAGVGVGQAKVFVRINRSIADADFVVQMGAGAAAAESNVSDGLSPVYILPNRDCEA